MSNDITIDVDGLPVPVDADEYDADPDAVAAEVRAAREGVLKAQEEFEPAEDYDSLTEKWGEPK